MAFELPENLSALSDDDLNAALNEGLDAFKELGITADSDEDTIAEGERIAPIIRAIRDEQQARVAAADARRTRAEELLATVPEQTAEVTEETVEEVTAEQEPEVVAEVEESVEEEAPTPIENEESVVDENTPVPVAASAESAVARAAANAPTQPAPTRGAPVSLLAAADVPGFATGKELADLTDVGKAVTSRARAFPKGRIGGEKGVFQRFGAAQIQKDMGEFTTGNRDFDNDQSLLDAVAREHRLSGGSLVAAGGWCAPSETLYDLCALESTDGLFSLPEIGITRGGISFTTGPDFSAIYNGSGWDLTEAEVIADTPKTCYEVPCPAFSEVRLDAMGVCIKAGLLTETAYPELVRRVIEGALVAHEHKVAKKLLGIIETAGGTPLAPVDQGATSSTAEALAWVAYSMRQKYAMADSATLEIVLPKWFKMSLREDIARRSGRVSVQVPDAELNGWFAERNIAPQFVYGLDDIDVSGGLAVKPPASTKALIYPAGTWIKGSASVINLDAVYDSTDLSTNTYTGLFTEEGVLAAQRCAETAVVTIPVCDSGRSGIADLAACFGTAETP